MKMRIAPLILSAAIIVAACSNERKNNRTNIQMPDTANGDTLIGGKKLDTQTQESPGGQLKPLSQQESVSIRTGKHAFTLQWIGWDKPGSVIIDPSEDGWYQVEGSQKNKSGDYITIEGVIKPLSKKELLFRGKIESRTSGVNRGKPCIREGEQLFKSTKGRKYWRLQNMQNCEGGLITDYVDIYF